MNFNYIINILSLLFMKSKNNATKITFLLEATYENNKYINIINYDYCEVVFGGKGRVLPYNLRDLEDSREKDELILAKNDNYDGKYLFIIIELSQEEGLAYMTNPKTISSLYHIDLKRMYNDIIHWRSYTNHNGIITV